jgi:septal ring factor EnvC (AmiA/AmiB activator)
MLKCEKLTTLDFKLTVNIERKFDMDPASITAILTGISPILSNILDRLLNKKTKKTINEEVAMSTKPIAHDVGTLQEQFKKLDAQVKTDKDTIEKHDKALIELTEATQQVLAAISKLDAQLTRLRIVSHRAIGLAGLSILAAILVAAFK